MPLTSSRSYLYESQVTVANYIPSSINSIIIVLTIQLENLVYKILRRRTLRESSTDNFLIPWSFRACFPLNVARLDFTEVLSLSCTATESVSSSKRVMGRGRRNNVHASLSLLFN